MYAFAPPAIPTVRIEGTDARFPVRRIHCVGRNYADHAKEMGAVVDRETPTFFSKPADAVVDGGGDVPYPPATQDLHHEVELVVALHSGGANLDPADALRHVHGYAVGLDLTRRDLQARAKQKGLPWDVAKGFDASAPISAIVPAARIGHPRAGRLQLRVNGTLRQDGDVADMIFSVPEILAELSKLYTLAAGDLVFTGTPAGVAALVPGDRFEATFDAHARLEGRIVAR